MTDATPLVTIADVQALLDDLYAREDLAVHAWQRFERPEDALVAWLTGCTIDLALRGCIVVGRTPQLLEGVVPGHGEYWLRPGSRAAQPLLADSVAMRFLFDDQQVGQPAMIGAMLPSGSARKQVRATFQQLTAGLVPQRGDYQGRQDDIERQLRQKVRAYLRMYPNEHAAMAPVCEQAMPVLVTIGLEPLWVARLGDFYVQWPEWIAEEHIGYSKRAFYEMVMPLILILRERLRAVL